MRSWLLRYHGLPLNTLSFDELRLIAEGKGDKARRAHSRALDPLPYRREAALLPHISAA